MIASSSALIRESAGRRLCRHGCRYRALLRWGPLSIGDGRFPPLLHRAGSRRCRALPPGCMGCCVRGRKLSRHPLPLSVWAFVDNGVFYKAIGAVHRDVAVYQIPFLQGGQVVDDDAWTSGRNEDMYAFGLGGSQRFNSGNGNFVGLEADQGSVDVKKTELFIIRGSFYLVREIT